MNKKKVYLGDGVYCEYDSYQFKLTAENGAYVTDIIYIDAGVWAALQAFVHQCMDEPLTPDP